MTQDREYEVFVANRQKLLEQSAVSREVLNDWIELHRSLDVSLTDLAILEGLLSDRKRHLEQLIELDEGLMLHLLEQRRR